MEQLWERAQQDHFPKTLVYFKFPENKIEKETYRSNGN
jgi:hypothetical protein